MLEMWVRCKYKGEIAFREHGNFVLLEVHAKREVCCVNSLRHVWCEVKTSLVGSTFRGGGYLVD